VIFPRVIIPLSSVLSVLVEYAISLGASLSPWLFSVYRHLECAC
jgi:hypothetical protein